MAESEATSSRDDTCNDLTESDMAAAHQLLLLSDEDNDCSIIGKRNRSFVQEQEEAAADQTLSDLIPTKINKIFWRDEVLATKKQRRYRSLEHIYMTTTPINA